MKLLFRTATLALLVFSFSSFSKPNNLYRAKYELCEAVKKIMKAFEEAEVQSLKEGIVIMGDGTQWTSKVSITGFKDQFVYVDGAYSSFEATLDKNINSLEKLNREIYYIASVLQTCLKVNMKHTVGADDIMYTYATDDVTLTIWGKRINSSDRSVVIEIGYE